MFRPAEAVDGRPWAVAPRRLGGLFRKRVSRCLFSLSGLAYRSEVTDSRGTAPGAFARATVVFVAIAAAAYGVVAVYALFHPRNPGKDLAWACVTLVLGTLVFWPRWDRLAMPVLIAGEGLLVVAVAILSGQALALLVAAGLLAVSHALGATILDAAGIAEESALDRTVLSLATGIALFALSFLALAATHLLYRPSLWIVIALAAVYSRRELRRELERLRQAGPSRERAAPPSLATRAAALIGGYLFLLAFLWAVAPEIQFDALIYHLALPRDYLAAHRIVRPVADPMYLAHLTEAFYGFGMGLGGDGVPKLLALAIGAAAAATVVAIGRKLAGTEAGTWAGLLFVSTPLVHALAATAQNDVAVSFFVAAAVLALLRIRAEKTAGGFVLCGGLAGAAVGAKLTALFAAPAIAALAVIELRRRQDARPGRTVILGGAAAIVALAPWYAVNYALTGSPIYPISSRLFPGKGVSDATKVLGRFGLGHSWKSAATIVLFLTYRTARFGEGLAAGAVGIAALLAALLVFGIVTGSRSVRIVSAIALLFSACWFGSFQYARYLLPAVALALPAALAVCPWRAGPSRRLLRTALSVTIFAQALVVPLQHWNIAGRFPLEVAFGRESRREFLERVVGPYRALEWLNGAVAPGEKIAVYGMVGLRYYCRAPMGSTIDTPELRGIFGRFDTGATARALDANAYRWLMLRTNPPAGRPVDIFLREYGQLAHEENGFRVFRLQVPK